MEKFRQVLGKDFEGLPQILAYSCFCRFVRVSLKPRVPVLVPDLGVIVMFNYSLKVLHSNSHAIVTKYESSLSPVIQA